MVVTVFPLLPVLARPLPPSAIYTYISTYNTVITVFPLLPVLTRPLPPIIYIYIHNANLAVFPLLPVLTRPLPPNNSYTIYTSFNLTYNYT